MIQESDKQSSMTVVVYINLHDVMIKDGRKALSQS